MAKARGHGDDQAQVGHGKFVQCVLVALISPLSREIAFVICGKHRFAHRCAYEALRAALKF
jgi:hypothetical protein